MYLSDRGLSFKFVSVTLPIYSIFNARRMRTRVMVVTLCVCVC